MSPRLERWLEGIGIAVLGTLATTAVLALLKRIDDLSWSMVGWGALGLLGLLLLVWMVFVNIIWPREQQRYARRHGLPSGRAAIRQRTRQRMVEQERRRREERQRRRT
ncbi:hypothetical protein ACFWBR_17325 [Streptomyces sp. NPDC060006]|uniref:hypothetical protein n=1 Tax=unclassified Streptomyces TaxID=2593676 RepID=UPI00362BA13A